MILQSLTENENLLLRNKNEGKIQYNAYVNNTKSAFPSDEIFITYNRTFKMSKNTRNYKETNNFKLTHFFQNLATANVIEDNIDEVSDLTFCQTADEKDIVKTIAGQSVEIKEKKNDRDSRDSIVKKNTRTKVREKGQTKFFREIFLWG